MGCSVPLRIVIGAANAAVVVLVAVVTLGLALSVSLATIEDNARRSVSKLGAAAVFRADQFFSRPAAHVQRVARYPQMSDPPLPGPFDHPTARMTAEERAVVGIGPGGAVAQRVLDLMATHSAEAGFEYLMFAAVTFEGSNLMLFPAPRGVLAAALDGKYGVRVVGQPQADDSMAADITVFLVEDGRVVNGTTDPAAGFIGSMYKSVLPVKDPRSAGMQRILTALVSPDSDEPRFTTPYFVTDKNDRPYFIMGVASAVRVAGATTGVSSIALRIDELGHKALDPAVLTTGTAVFLVDGGGFVTGASGSITATERFNYTHGRTRVPAGCTTTADSAGIYPSLSHPQMGCRLHLSRVGHTALRSAVRQAPEAFDLAAARGGGRLRRLADQFVFSQQLPALAGSRFELLLVVVVPVADILGNAGSILALTASVSTAVVVLVAVASFGLVWWLLAPLKGLAARMAAAARLEDDQPEGGRSAMTEIADLEDAFAAMVAELNRIRAFVPQSLLRAGSEGEDEDDDDEQPAADDRSAEGLSRQQSNLKSGRMFSAARGTTVSVYSAAGSATSGTDAALSKSPSKSPGGSRADMRRQTAVTLSADTSVASLKAKRRAGARIVDGVRRENVSVLCLNLRGFAAVTAIAVDAAKVAATVEVVLAAATAQKGVVDSFHGDRFIVTFNAARPAAAHGARAAVTAARIAAAMPEVGYGLRISAGVASGPAHVGNQGCADLKRFTLVGPAVPQAAALERLCLVQAPSVSCLVPHRLASDLRTAVDLAPADYVRLPHAQKPTLLWAVLRELAACDEAANDEWMYQLQQQDASTTAEASPARRLEDLWLGFASGATPPSKVAADLPAVRRALAAEADESQPPSPRPSVEGKTAPPTEQGTGEAGATRIFSADRLLALAAHCDGPCGALVGSAATAPPPRNVTDFYEVAVARGAGKV